MPSHIVALQSAHPIKRANNLSRLLSSAISALLIFALTAVAAAQSESKPARSVGDSSRVTIAHSRLPLSGASDLGPLDQAQKLNRMILVLKTSPAKRQALATLLDSQQAKGSANYHRWLTPEEFRQQFALASSDLEKIQSWLEQQGFRVGAVARSGMWIEFSGTAGQVNNAFQTRMRRYQVNGETHIANASDISIPSALAPLVEGVPLHDFFSKPMFVPSHAQSFPAITAPWNNAAHAIVPGDFATIYDLNGLYKSGLNGKGQTIAIVAEADITPSDISSFQSIFGLPPNLPNVIDNGIDPGVDLLLGYGEEATIDAEWSSAIAPGAAIDLVVSEPTETTDGATLSALYIVDHDLAQIVSVSYANCEQNLGTAGNALWNALWQQAAAQGMSVFVASGDDGSVMCNASGLDLEAGYGPMSVNGLASTPYNTAVGGTEFDEGANGGSASTFWSNTNAKNLASATGYIPEFVWNDSCDDSNNPYLLQNCPNTLPTLAATGGGVSTVYPTPSWQTLNITGLNALTAYSLPNQPGVSPRGIPDISLPASADHDGYLFCFTTVSATPDCQLVNGAFAQTTFQNEAGGTSFGTPAFAGIMAIVNQQAMTINSSPSPVPITDGRQGLANYTLYSLAASETFSACNSSNRTNPSQAAPAACTFNDITSGNNGPPGEYSATGVTGYSTAAGYDLVSGLGSVDAHNLVSNWTAAGAGFHGSETVLTANAGSSNISIQHGQGVSFDVTVQKLSGDTTSQSPSGQISLIAQSGNLSGSMGLDAATLVASAAGTATSGSLDFGNLPGGSYSVVARYPGNGYFAGSISAAIPVTVTAENSATTLNVGHYVNGYGSPVRFDVQVSGASGQGYPSGQVTLADGGTVFAQLPLSSNGEASLNTCAPPSNAISYPPYAALPCFGVGSHNFTATYSGDTSFNPSPAPPAASQLETVVIPPGEALMSVGSAPMNASGLLNVPNTLSTSVYSTSSGAVPPTGTVQYFLNSTSLGPPVPLSGNPPQASLPNVVFQQGKFTLAANYSGDSNYNPANFVETSTWGSPLGWTGTTTTATINPGQTATFNLTLSASGYTGQVPLKCTVGPNPNQPTENPIGTACNVTPTSVNFTSTTTSAPVVMTIASSTQSHLAPAPFGTLPFTLPPVLALVLWGTRKKHWRTHLQCAVAALAISVMTSCSGAGTTTPPPPVLPPATSVQFTVSAPYTISLGGGDSDSGSVLATVTVNINQ
jgi:Pro-kumamolisin, activation domain/Bacterial Ig-like domain (group 3)